MKVKKIYNEMILLVNSQNHEFKNNVFISNREMYMDCG